jgi:hypothetical protein
MLSRHRQYSFDCSSIISEEFFWATFATAMTISLVFRQFSSVFVAKKRDVAAMFCSRDSNVSNLVSAALDFRLV